MVVEGTRVEPDLFVGYGAIKVRNLLESSWKPIGHRKGRVQHTLLLWLGARQEEDQVALLLNDWRRRRR